MVKEYIDKSIKRLSSISPQAAIAGALIIVILVAGAALLLTRGSSEAKASPALQPYAARLDRVDGSVGIARVVEGDKQQLDWAEATINTPVSVGDRVFARDYAHASIALNGQNYVRLNPGTSLDVLALEERRAQFALHSGSAVFDVGSLPGELYEVATPCGAVDFREPGLYQIGMDGDNAIISVLNGLAQVVGQGGSGYISKGQVFTLTSATATEALASSLGVDTAGQIVDDYYRYRYPKVYDGRYRSYDAYLGDPSYYDPYRTSVSYQYLPANIPGLYDLDYYGDWVDVNDYGYCWAPRVSSGWAPYRSGYWDLDYLWGPSWVSYEPWGWAPYHYGRWAFVNQRWFWVPVEVRTRAVYSPATVAFIPFADQIAWIPLAPGEVYVSRYYDDFQPRYFASPDVVRVVTVQNTFVNFGAPNAVTVVPLRAFNTVIDPQVIAPVDVAVVQKSRAVIDPFSVAEVRELATRGEDGRRRIKLERHEQEALNTAVVASSTPDALPARGDLTKRFKVEAVPERGKKSKLNINETGQVTSARRADGIPQPLAQSQRINELASRAEQGDKAARREMRQLMREEQRAGNTAAGPQGVPPAMQPQAGQEQLRQQMKQQRRAERQQQAADASSQDAARAAQQRQQVKQQRRAERQQQSAAAAQKQQLQQQQQQQMRQQRQMQEQRKAQPRAPKRKPPETSFQRPQELRIQRAQQEAARHQSYGQQQQRKAQLRVGRQHAVMQQQAARAQAAQRQAVMQQQAVRAQAAQRQAEKQQQYAARSQAAQRQAVIQEQAIRAQAAQRQAVKQQQQAARAQAAQRQAVSPQMQRAPSFVGPPARQGASERAPKGQRKPN